MPSGILLGIFTTSYNLRRAEKRSATEPTWFRNWVTMPEKEADVSRIRFSETRDTEMDEGYWTARRVNTIWKDIEKRTIQVNGERVLEAIPRTEHVGDS